MGQPIPRKTVYAATVITLLALAGGWTLAIGTTTTTGPAQSSNITVTTPGGFVLAAVQSTQLLTVSDQLILGVVPAGMQAAGSGGGLNSTITQNAVLPTCPGSWCEANYSAVDTGSALTLGDTALQIMLLVQRPTVASGFDVQVEVVFSVSGGPSMYAFGNGYFDSAVQTTAHGTVSVGLYIDLGENAVTSAPSVSSIVVTMNNCQTATTCP
jgi:hypothetical protein